MKKLLRPSSAILSSESGDYMNHYTYTRSGQRFSVNDNNPSNPDWFQFIMSELHPYDDADYAWAKKDSPVELKIIKSGQVQSRIPLPEWDYDSYEDEDEYYGTLIDIAAVALLEANRDVQPMIDHT